MNEMFVSPKQEMLSQWPTCEASCLVQATYANASHIFQIPGSRVLTAVKQKIFVMSLLIAKR